jgi:hypothetical protein
MEGSSRPNGCSQRPHELAPPQEVVAPERPAESDALPLAGRLHEERMAIDLGVTPGAVALDSQLGEPQRPAHQAGPVVVDRQERLVAQLLDIGQRQPATQVIGLHTGKTSPCRAASTGSPASVPCRTRCPHPPGARPARSRARWRPLRNARPASVDRRLTETSA